MIYYRNSSKNNVKYLVFKVFLETVFKKFGGQIF